MAEYVVDCLYMIRRKRRRPWRMMWTSPSCGAARRRSRSIKPNIVLFRILSVLRT
jgi:hypothetical protein